MADNFKRRFIVSVVITIPILLLSPLVREFLGIEDAISFNGDEYLLFALATILYLYGGFPFLKGFYHEIKSLSPGMMTLIALAISVAYIYSSAVVFGISGSVFFWELATLIDIMLLGHWLEMKSVDAASSSLDEISRLIPSIAHKLTSGDDYEDTAVDSLVKGDHILVKPGEKIPADGTVISGHSAVNESLITGESAPVEKQEEDEVIGGSINGEGIMEVEVRRSGEDSYLAEISRMIENAQQSKSKSQLLADRAAFSLTVIALGAGILTLAGWLLLGNSDFEFALSRMVTVMVITCPHALGLAIPLVIAVSTSLAVKENILIKDREGFEQARKISALIFDKTGTLTEGKFSVTDILVIDKSYTSGDILSYAASLEKISQHPIALAVAQAAGATWEVQDFKSMPGKGVEGIINLKDVKVVSPGYVMEKSMRYDNQVSDTTGLEGKTVVYVIIDNEPAALIALEDTIRPESRTAIDRLKAGNIRPIMITGDSEASAARVASRLGIEEYFSGVLPEEKAKKVKEVQSRGIKTGMVGDGVNDAPALAQADVGIAIGTGTDVAMATADVVLTRSNPEDTVSVVSLSKSTYRKMQQNLAWATGYNIIASI